MPDAARQAGLSKHALGWQDIDFEARRSTPVKQVQRVKGEGLVLKDLKTESSQALLPLPEFCARALEERRERQELERKIAGETLVAGARP